MSYYEEKKYEDDSKYDDEEIISTLLQLGFAKADIINAVNHIKKTQNKQQYLQQIISYIVNTSTQNNSIHKDRQEKEHKNDEEVSDCDQESIVTGNDSRERITKSTDKHKYIIRCIGELSIEYRYVAKDYKPKSFGTATVFHVHNKRAYAITAAHNTRAEVNECTDCDIYMSKKNIYCRKCGSNQYLKTIIIKATKIKFARNEINAKTTEKDEDGANVVYEYGDTKQSYICSVEYIPDDEYRKAAHAKSGNDYAIISFKVTDDYNYKKYSKYVFIENEQKKLENKQIENFSIWGYPHYENKMVGLLGMQSTTKKYEVKKYDQTGNLYLEQKEIDTSGGQSGASLWHDTDDDKAVKIFAIHTGGSNKYSYNVATIINSDILAVIKHGMDSKLWKCDKCNHENSGGYKCAKCDIGVIIQPTFNDDELVDKLLAFGFDKSIIIEAINNAKNKQNVNDIVSYILHKQHQPAQNKEQLLPTFIDSLYQKYDNIDRLDVIKLHSFLETNNYDTDTLLNDIKCIDPIIFSNLKNKVIRKKSNYFQHKAIRKKVNDMQLLESTYQVGYHFYYWDFYKNNEDLQSPSPQHLNPIRKKELFVPAKYSNLKDELINNKYCSFSLNQWNKTLSKAEIKYKEWRKDSSLIASKDLHYYSIQEGSEISLQHIMSVMLYCNYSSLEYEFTRTFINIYTGETLYSVKKRNQEFRWWSKLLRETVCCYGTRFGDSKLAVLYHGHYNVMFCPGIRVAFAVPIAWSVDFMVALGFFAKDHGMIMDIKISDQPPNGKYFNVVNWSDYPEENARITFGCHSPLQILTIHHVALKENYENLLAPLTAFQRILDGSKPQLEKEIMKTCNISVGIWFVDRKNAMVNKFSTYIRSQFEVFCKSQRKIILDLPYLETIKKQVEFCNVIMNEIQKIGKVLQSKDFLHSTNIFKSDMLQVFDNVHDITINTTSNDGRYSYAFNLFSLLYSLQSSTVDYVKLLVTAKKKKPKLSLNSQRKSWITDLHKEPSWKSVQTAYHQKHYKIVYKSLNQKEDCLIIEKASLNSMKNYVIPRTIKIEDVLPSKPPCVIEFKWNKNMKNKTSCDTQHMLYLLQIALELVRLRTVERNKYFKSISRTDRCINILDSTQIITNLLDWFNQDPLRNMFDGELLEKSEQSFIINEILVKIGYMPLGSAINVYTKLTKDVVVETTIWLELPQPKLQLKTYGYTAMIRK